MHTPFAVAAAAVAVDAATAVALLMCCSRSCAAGIILYRQGAFVKIAQYRRGRPSGIKRSIIQRDESGKVKFHFL